MRVYISISITHSPLLKKHTLSAIIIKGIWENSDEYMKVIYLAGTVVMDKNEEREETSGALLRIPLANRSAKGDEAKWRPG